MSSAKHLALSATDESVHLRPQDAPDTWQENCFVMGYDESRDLSVYFHVERLADRIEIKAAAGRGDAITSAHSNDDAWPEVVVPFEHLRLDWADEQIGFDLELRSEIPAIDHAEALSGRASSAPRRPDCVVARRRVDTP